MRELLNGYAVQDIFNGSNTELSLSFLSHVVMENIEGRYSHIWSTDNV